MTAVATPSVHEQAVALFRAQFDIVPATTPSLRAEAFRVRHRVYCEELGYEQGSPLAGPVESDPFDARSRHVLLRDRFTGRFVACIRMVMPDGDAPFPMERACPNAALPAGRARLCEISRMTVVREFRAKLHASMGLAVAATALVFEGGFDRALALMEPRLARHLRAMGIWYEPIGAAVQFHGERVPYAVDPRSIPPRMDESLRELLDDVRAIVRRARWDGDTSPAIHDTAVALFRAQFEIVLATTPELRTEAFRVRHQVYCEELGYEPALASPVESDLFDARSRLVLLRDRESGRFVGCVRTIFTDPRDPRAPFPMERVCGASLRLPSGDRSKLCEMSRMTLLREFRGRLHASLGLAVAAAATGLESGCVWSLALMEPRLARHLHALGIWYEPVSEPVQFRGERVGYAVLGASIAPRMAPPVRALLEDVRGLLRRSGWTDAAVRQTA